MTEENDETKPKKDSGKSDNKVAEQKLSDIKVNKQVSESGNKKLLLAISTVLVVMVIAGIAFFVSSDFDDGDEVSQEQQLSYAEEQALYKVPDTASNEKKNIVAMSNAWAFYNEQNYDRALEILNAMIDPSEDKIVDQNSLYGLIYEAQGDAGKAAEYFQSDLAQYEEQLLNDIKTDPTAHFTLADMYDKAGETAKAMEHYEAYIVVVEAPRDEMEEHEYETMIKAKEAIDRLRT